MARRPDGVQTPHEANVVRQERKLWIWVLAAIALIGAIYIATTDWGANPEDDASLSPTTAAEPAAGEQER